MPKSITIQKLLYINLIEIFLKGMIAFKQESINCSYLNFIIFKQMLHPLFMSQGQHKNVPLSSD